ncbi:hypothetical protein FRC12_009215 [Ceratobasidium sp. 428]|nr:hypothetical protein FRC12_009215 [Ceratobasidium sp. 428]
MIDRLLEYANAFPSIFGAIQRKRWAADLEKCQVRDTHSNKTQFQALVDAQDRTLVAALEDDALKKDLQTVAQDFGMFEDLYMIMSSPNGTTTSSNHESPRIVASSPQSSAKVPLFTHASPDISTNELHSSARSRQGSLDMIWNTISKLEEHVGGDPAFESQMVQLRKLAQAAMISTDEGVSERAKPNLLKQATVTSSPAVSGPPQPSLQVTLPNQSLKLRVAEFTQDSLQIPAEPSLAIQDSRKKHVLEYIKSHPSSDRFRLCLGIGQGLAHMHALGIVLGDFAPWNVIVDESGNVQLRELNLSSSINGRPVGRGTWRSQLPDARYIPPEVITLPPEAEGGTDPNPTKSDVYAFTLLLFEILSGVAPWDKLDIPSIVSQVTRGNRPTRPTRSAWLHNNDVWSLIQQGWHQQPENRPDMTSYACNLEGWKHFLPATQNNDPFSLTQPLASPTTEQFLARKTEDLTIMDDLSFDITREVKMVSELYAPFAHGGFCDIFIGRRGVSEKVAMKRLRIATIGDEDVLKKRFIRECEVWRKLKHPNVLEFHGIVKHGGSLFMISPFLDGGDAPTWLKTRCEERLRVLLGAARGCLYLHTILPKPTIHGDIKGANILIKADGQAVLSDFGLSKTMNAHTSRGLKDTGTGPYMAPELFAHCDDPESEVDATMIPITKTLETDVFAFGRTAIEVSELAEKLGTLFRTYSHVQLLGGQIPYGNAAATPAIWYILLQGKRPGRPTTSSAKKWITDPMWTFINEMTHVQPECRPTTHEIVARLERFSYELDSGHSSTSEDNGNLSEEEIRLSPDASGKGEILPHITQSKETPPFIPHTSTPPLLRSGRPLKPSLKSGAGFSMSSPDMSSMLALAKRAPSNPRVHFPPRLESVVFFDPRARPAEIRSEDSPLETPQKHLPDTDASSDLGVGSEDSRGEPGPPRTSRSRLPMFPFPVSSIDWITEFHPRSQLGPMQSKSKLKIAAARSAVLQPTPRPDACVHIAAVRLFGTRLRGSVLVKNMGFCKIVALRYTFDNWRTTSEVSCTWSSPDAIEDLPAAEPKPLDAEETEIDIARGILVPVPNGWDRFVFSIRLDDVARLNQKAMLLAARFSVPNVGEWWDNCDGANYRFEFDYVSETELDIERTTTTCPSVLNEPLGLHHR